MSIEGKIVENVGEKLEWHAMSATFGRELKAKSFLESKAVQCFIPMKYEIVNDRRLGKTRKLIPAVNNLIFVYATRKHIQDLKKGVDYLQYLTQPVNGRNVPITVPEYQMQQFISVCDTHNEKLIYLSPNEVDLAKGTRVKIVGSAFDGVEGIFVKVEKSRKKRVVVQLQGIAAVMIAEISDGYIQVLD